MNWRSEEWLSHSTPRPKRSVTCRNPVNGRMLVIIDEQGNKEFFALPDLVEIIRREDPEAFILGLTLANVGQLTTVISPVDLPREPEDSAFIERGDWPVNSWDSTLI